MPLRVRVPAPVLVMPPVIVPFQFVMFELIVVIAPEFTTLIFPELNSLISMPPVPLEKVTFPVVALLASVHVVALAEFEELPFPAPNVILLPPAVLFNMLVAFDELKPWLKEMELA